MKNSLFFVYYLDKGTEEQSIIKNLLYIIPFSQFIKKYNKNNYASINLTSWNKKKDYILIDWYQNISCDFDRIISYKKHSLKNIMTTSNCNMVQIIAFSKKTKINEIIDEIFPYCECGDDIDDIEKAKDKVRNFIIETIKEYEK